MYMNKKKYPVAHVCNLKFKKIPYNSIRHSAQCDGLVCRPAPAVRLVLYSGHYGPG